MNRVILIGNLGKDVEIRQSASGSSIGSMSLATKERVKNGDKWDEKTSWHRITLFGSTADNAAKFLSKGSQCAIEGRIQYSEYQKDGKTVYATEIVCDRLEFVGSKNESQPASSSQSRSNAKPDDDIPF